MRSESRALANDEGVCAQSRRVLAEVDELRARDVHALRASKTTRRHEQRGERYAVIVQSDDLILSTVLVAPTSRSASAHLFRPTITIGDEPTQVLVEHTAAVPPERLGRCMGQLSVVELAAVDEALRLVLELD